MLLNELRIANLRNIQELEFRPAAGFNLLIGANGAGKSTILEAIYLLSHGSSFRPGRNDVLVRNGVGETSVFGVVRGLERQVRLGLLLRSGRWVGRLDGHDTSTLTALLGECAVVCFEPGSHALISGASEGRRRFLDWGVFHVEPTFAVVARRYRLALRQRNEALRQNCSPSELLAWDDELATAAEPLVHYRSAYLQRITPHLHRLLKLYLPDLGETEVCTRGGWHAGAALKTLLQEQHAVDRARGHTTRGPHRADWSIRFAESPRREQLSRGQEKLCAIACVLAQAALFQADRGEWPIVVLDDLSSELDASRQRTTLESLREVGQVFVSGTDIPAALRGSDIEYQTFHVEQGRMQALL